MSDQPTEPMPPNPSQGPGGPPGGTPGGAPTPPSGAGWPGQMPPPPPGMAPMMPMMSGGPTPPPPAAPGAHRKQFFLGLGTGIIPLALALLATGIFVGTGHPPGLATPFVIGLVVAGVMYLASIIAMIICLARARLRFIGYGLLATFLATPVIGFVSCIAALNYATTHP